MAAPTPAAPAPLPRSRSNTTSPAFHPRRRKTFDAPGFPDPSCRTSRPWVRAISPALGKLPTRYATGTRHATRITAGILPLWAALWDDEGPSGRLPLAVNGLECQPLGGALRPGRATGP